MYTTSPFFNKSNPLKAFDLGCDPGKNKKHVSLNTVLGKPQFERQLNTLSN
jgi:hypothetical protein